MGVVKKQAVTNTILVYIGTLIGFVSLIFIQPVFLTKEELGLTRLILSFGSILSILFSFGISAVTVRFLPKTFGPEHKHRGFFGFLLMYTTISILIGLVIIYFSKGFIYHFYSEGSQQFNEHFKYVILLTIINAYLLGINSYSIALLKTTFPTFLNDILLRILLVAIIFLHFYGYLTLDQFLLAYCLTFAITCLFLLTHIFFIDKPGLIPDTAYIKKNIGYYPIIRYGVIITFTAMNSLSLKYLDSIFVGKVSLGAVGIYSVAAFIGLMIEIPLNALERIANPSIAHAMANDNMKEIKNIYFQSSRFLFIIGGWLFIMMASNIHDLLTFLPVDYREGTTVSLFIGVGALINMATGINYPILINSNKYIWGSVFLVVLVIMTITGNILLIPHFGMLGAAITACVASAIYNLLKYLFIWKRFQLQPFDLRSLYTVLIITALSFAGFFLPIHLHPVIAIAIKVTVLTFLFFALIIFTRCSEDLYQYIPEKIRNRFSFLKAR